MFLWDWFFNVRIKLEHSIYGSSCCLVTTTAVGRGSDESVSTVNLDGTRSSCGTFTPVWIQQWMVMVTWWRWVLRTCTHSQDSLVDSMVKLGLPLRIWHGCIPDGTITYLACRKEGVLHFLRLTYCNDVPATSLWRMKTFSVVSKCLGSNYNVTYFSKLLSLNDARHCI